MSKFATIRRGLALGTAALLGAFAAVALSVPSSGGAAPATVYTTTVTGTELRALTPDVQPLLRPNTGGGVEAAWLDLGNEIEPAHWLEAPIALPVGAKVTSVSLTYTPCLLGRKAVLFGSYSPTQGTFATHRNLTPSGDACERATTHWTGNPIVTVAPGRRYVIDWQPDIVDSYEGFPIVFSDVFNGFTVRYTCTAPCVP